MTPDYDTPSGGVQVMYQWVGLLRGMGLDAVIWHGRPGFRNDDLDVPGRSRVPVRDGLRQTLAPGDVLVVPEAGGPAHRHLTADARVVVLNQGHYLGFAGIAQDEDLGEGYPGWDQAVAAIATSRAIERFLLLVTPEGYPVHHIPVSLEEGVFAPGPKQRVIAYMTHRRPTDMVMLTHALRRSGSLDGWRLQPLVGLSRAEVASVLRTAAIFVSTAERDGFGLPGLEALASGCLVVGHTGDGGQEFLDDSNALLVGEADVARLTERVREAMRIVESDPGRVRELSEHGRAAAGRFTPLATAQRLHEVFTGLSEARQPSPVEVRHFSTHAPRESLVYDLRVTARGAARQTADALVRAARRRRDR